MTEASRNATERRPAECFPAVLLVKEEIDVRRIPLEAFLQVVEMRPERWNALLAGSEGLLISEAQRLAGALGISYNLLIEMNLSYQQWKRAQR